jgi:hypothetical protein
MLRGRIYNPVRVGGAAGDPRTTFADLRGESTWPGGTEFGLSAGPLSGGLRSKAASVSDWRRRAGVQMAPTPLIRRKKVVKRTKKFARNQSDLFNRVDVCTSRPSRSSLAATDACVGCNS